MVRNPSANAADAGNSGLISGLGRPPGERKKWQLIPIFLPGKFHGQGTWWAIVHGVAKSRTRLNTHTCRAPSVTLPS